MANYDAWTIELKGVREHLFWDQDLPVAEFLVGTDLPTDIAILSRIDARGTDDPEVMKALGDIALKFAKEEHWAGRVKSAIKAVCND